ncbi:hypothetical protein Pmani_029894 [Petrolisthes manimaculis]|uniref:Uncharacterized protein n=1 Tax=Petrolisthes manimaculis TaxID=1843537 RepID=A0AAE1TWK1_9EUCA|nr:hypothetical protein Pmani_029894 [Petrolisthes manimaculis]
MKGVDCGFDVVSWRWRWPWWCDTSLALCNVTPPHPTQPHAATLGRRSVGDGKTWGRRGAEEGRRGAEGGWGGVRRTKAGGWQCGGREEEGEEWEREGHGQEVGQQEGWGDELVGVRR